MTVMGKRLNQFVEVGGVWYGPKDDVPDDVAEKISNPAVWATDEATSTGRNNEEKAAKAGTESGARLALYVDVAGISYGPNDHVPDDVAAKIVNPSAWVDRKLPPAAERAAREQARERTAATPPPLPGSGTPAVRAADVSFADATLTPDAMRRAQERADEADDDEREGDVPPPEGIRPVPPAKKAVPRKATGSGA